jgi:hypothetical protein
MARILASSHADNIIGESLARFKSVETRAVEVCSSVLNSQEKALLDHWSIPHASFPHGRIPHPVLKALENHRNVNTLPFLLSGRVNVVSMKMAKVRKLRARCPNADIRVFNPVITPADVSRFSEPADLPAHDACDIVVFDDCLHHIAPNVVAAYMDLWDASRCYGTFISPPESWERLGSIHPTLYGIQYFENKYVFTPADNESASYEQHYGDSGWHDLGSFTCGANYDVELLISYGPYHLVSIVRDLAAPVRREFRTFDAPKVVRLPDLPGFPSSHSPWFPVTLFAQSIFHAGALKKLGQSDVLARMRGLFAHTLAQGIPLETWEHFGACCRIAGLKVSDPVETRLAGSLSDRLFLALEEFIRDNFAESFYLFFYPDRRLINAVREALNREVVHFTVTLRHDVLFEGFPRHELPEQPPVLGGVAADPPVVPPERLPAPPPARLNHGPRPFVPPVNARRLPHPGNPVIALNPVRREVFFDLPRALRHAPDFVWEPSLDRGHVPESCGHVALRELNPPGDETWLEFFGRLHSMLPNVELARLRGDPGVSTQIFFHAAALLLGISIEIHLPGAVLDNAVTLVGVVDGQRFDVFGILTPDGRGHWQTVPNPFPQQVGPPGIAANPLFTGGSINVRSFFSSLLPPGCPTFAFTPNPKSAKVLFDEMSEKVTGMVTVLPKWSDRRPVFEAAVRAGSNRSVEIAYVSGVAGSGKSFLPKTYLQSRSRELSWFINVVSPLRDLNTAWLAAFPNASPDQRQLFKTHEKALFSSPEIVVFDEAQKLPGFYLDLYVLTHPTVRYVVLLGEPYQCGAPITNPASQLRATDSPGLTLSPSIGVHFEVSWRVNSHVAACWNIPIAHARRAGISMVTSIPAGCPIVVTTVASQNVIREYGQEAYTLSSCGGQDFNGPYCVILTRELLTGVPPEGIYTGFTRSRHEIYVLNALTPAQTRDVMASSPLLGALLNSQVLPNSYRDYIGNRLPPGVVVPPLRLFPAGVLLTVSDVVGGDSALLTKSESLVPILRDAMLALPAERVESDVSPVKITHAPASEEWVPSYFGRYGDPKNDLTNAGFHVESVEMSGDPLPTKQFDDIKFAPADRLENLCDFFPVHRSNDAALFGPTVAKRLRFASESENLAEFASASFLGPLLTTAFVRDLGLEDVPVPWDDELFDFCVDDCARKRLSKPLSMLNNLERDQDPSLRDNHTVLNFLKGQLINKLDTLTRFSESDNIGVPTVKPAQMITTYTEEINAFFGPLTRYLATKLRLSLPDDHVLFYGGYSLSDLDDWSRRHVPANLSQSFANDYTAYDKSCRGDSLQFEVCIMRFFNVPERFIDLHVDLTCHLNSALGHLGIMRTSGQWCTYLFNSWFNAAYFALKYDYPKEIPRGFSGDDMFILCVPKIRKGWSRLSIYFALIGKPVIARNPEFCGWILSCHGIVRHPMLLLLKSLYHVRNNSFDNVVINYFIEHSFGTRLGDALHEILPPELISAFGECIALFSGHMSKIPDFLRPVNLLGSTFLRPPSFHPIHLDLRVMKMDWRHVSSPVRRAILSLGPPHKGY